ncbi:PEP-CTERM sorting domain-containing protein [Haloferula sargassicola]|uniref:PEP-CTERM protein-sorting domain-containing protein n=1 Tax=Haloferula sargassicola TaxID=490096 RepID=A0ABP9UMC3_9BACT
MLDSRLSVVASFLFAASAQAAFVIQVDTDGADDGPVTYPANFSFGGDTTTAASSTDAGTVGTQPGDSLFGGDGVNQPDTYVYTYEPGLDGDNTPLLAGTILTDEGDTATGVTAGGSGLYNVWATWPRTSNVSGGDVRYTLTAGLTTLFDVLIDQNAENLPDALEPGKDAEWVLLGQADLEAGTAYRLTQQAGLNTFVSMRAFAVMFEPVPEPSVLALSALGLPALLRRRR